MDVCRYEVPRKAWDLPFLAEAEELAGLRRIVRLHLTLWGLPSLVEVVQLCVTELVTNVITHVGPGTPVTLSVSMNGTRIRVEVEDPDARALPTLLAAKADDEAGRGMALVDAIAARWGVALREDSKSTWCEFATGLDSRSGHVDSPGVARAEELVVRCQESGGARATGGLGLGPAEEAAIMVIADLLHWLSAHGFDPDEALDRAQTCFESCPERAE